MGFLFFVKGVSARVTHDPCPGEGCKLVCVNGCQDGYDGCNWFHNNEDGSYESTLVGCL